MFPSGTVERFDVSLWCLIQIFLLPNTLGVVCGSDSMFHAGSVCVCVCVEGRDSTFHTGTVERFDLLEWRC